MPTYCHCYHRQDSPASLCRWIDQRNNSLFRIFSHRLQQRRRTYSFSYSQSSVITEWTLPRRELPSSGDFDGLCLHDLDKSACIGCVQLLVRILFWFSSCLSCGAYFFITSARNFRWLLRCIKSWKISGTGESTRWHGIHRLIVMYTGLRYWCFFQDDVDD